MPSRKLFRLLIALLLAPAAARAETVWVEGEAAAVKNSTPHGWNNGVK